MLKRKIPSHMARKKVSPVKAPSKKASPKQPSLPTKRAPHKVSLPPPLAVPDSNIVSLITRRRRQIIVHSIIYYRLNDSIISDSTFDKWARELVELQEKYPKEASEAMYAKEFIGFDGSTGFYLVMVGDLIFLAERLLKMHRERRA